MKTEKEWRCYLLLHLKADLYNTILASFFPIHDFFVNQLFPFFNCMFSFFQLGIINLRWGASASAGSYQTVMYGWRRASSTEIRLSGSITSIFDNRSLAWLVLFCLAQTLMGISSLERVLRIWFQDTLVCFLRNSSQSAAVSSWTLLMVFQAAQ